MASHWKCFVFQAPSLVGADGGLSHLTFLKLNEPLFETGFLFQTLSLTMKTCRTFIYEGPHFFKYFLFINIYEVQITIVVSPRNHWLSQGDTLSPGYSVQSECSFHLLVVVLL